MSKQTAAPAGRNDALREAINEAAPTVEVSKIVGKDTHLIEAALAGDKIIISLDETVANHLAQLTDQVSDLANIVWVNPSVDSEQVINWLERGAKPVASWRLSRRARS